MTKHYSEVEMFTIHGTDLHLNLHITERLKGGGWSGRELEVGVNVWQMQGLSLW